MSPLSGAECRGGSVRWLLKRIKQLVENTSVNPRRPHSKTRLHHIVTERAISTSVHNDMGDSFFGAVALTRTPDESGAG